MARPTKYDWVEIKHKFECGITIDEIVKKDGVNKNTLSNRVSKEKWKVMVDVKDAIREASESYGKVTGLSEALPEKAEIIANEINERTQHILFFNRASLKNQSIANKKLSKNLTLSELEAHSRLTARNKETVLGKQPDTAIQINNNQAPQKIERVIIDTDTAD